MPISKSTKRRQINNESTKRLYARRKLEGRCRCGVEVNGGMYCEECKAKRHANEKCRRLRRCEEGKCTYCGNAAMTSKRSVRDSGFATCCWSCMLKVLAHNLLGSGKKWPILVEKLEACGWKCSYTGETLVPGDNLSFDHMDPASRFPDKRHDPNNIEPVSLQVNLMKRDLTKEEFLATVKKIYRRQNDGS